MIRRVLPIALGTVATLAAVAGGALHVRHTIGDADVDAPADLGVSALPDRYADDGTAALLGGAAHTELSALLLPAQGPYHLGPDIGEWGNDAEMTGEEATALLKDSVADWPRDFREEMQRVVDELDLRGVAMRSYEKHRLNLAADDPRALVVETTLTAYGAAADAEDMHAGVRDQIQDSGVFQDGPEVPGFPEARCYVAPTGEDLLRFMDIDPDEIGYVEEDSDPDRMTCTAATGEYHISLTAYGTVPLLDDDVAELLADQLSHIDSPGTFV